jgi:hypothetical protein
VWAQGKRQRQVGSGSLCMREAGLRCVRTVMQAYPHPSADLPQPPPQPPPLPQALWELCHSCCALLRLVVTAELRGW